jgi:transposase
MSDTKFVEVEGLIVQMDERVTIRFNKEKLREALEIYDTSNKIKKLKDMNAERVDIARTKIIERLTKNPLSFLSKAGNERLIGLVRENGLKWIADRCGISDSTLRFTVWGAPVKQSNIDKIVEYIEG